MLRPLSVMRVVRSCCSHNRLTVPWAPWDAGPTPTCKGENQALPQAGKRHLHVSHLIFRGLSGGNTPRGAHTRPWVRPATCFPLPHGSGWRVLGRRHPAEAATEGRSLPARHRPALRAWHCPALTGSARSDLASFSPPSPAHRPREVKSLVQVTRLAVLGPGPEPTQAKEQKLLCADIGPVCVA